MKLEDLEIYSISMELSDDIWDIVLKWNYFAKITVGKQLVEAADSIGANISEGFGRYYFRDSRTFYYFSRGSLFETKTWLYKAKKRDLLPTELADTLIAKCDKLGVKLNNFITAFSKKANISQK